MQNKLKLVDIILHEHLLDNDYYTTIFDAIKKDCGLNILDSDAHEVNSYKSRLTLRLSEYINSIYSYEELVEMSLDVNSPTWHKMVTPKYNEIISGETTLFIKNLMQKHAAQDLTSKSLYMLKKIRLITFTLSFLAFICAATGQQVTLNTDLHLEQLRQKYRDDLEQQRKDLIDRFFITAGLTGITQSDCDKYVDKNRKQIIDACASYGRNNLEPIPQNSRLAIIANKLLKQHSIDPSTIDLFYDDKIYTMASLPKALFINRCMEQKKDLEIECSILHEIQHLLFEDTVIEMCMRDFLSSGSASPKNGDDFLTQWSHFREKRADILASLSSIEHAQAHYEFFLSQSSNYPAGPNYPCHAERTATLKDVYLNMQDCYTKASIETLGESWAG